MENGNKSTETMDYDIYRTRPTMRNISKTRRVA